MFNYKFDNYRNEMFNKLEKKILSKAMTGSPTR